MSLESNLALVKFLERMKEAPDDDARARACIDFIGKNSANLKTETRQTVAKLSEFVVSQDDITRVEYEESKILSSLSYVQAHAGSITPAAKDVFAQIYEVAIPEDERSGTVCITTAFKAFGRDPVATEYARRKAEEYFIKESMERGNLTMNVNNDIDKNRVLISYSYRIGNKYPITHKRIDEDGNQDN